MEASFDRVYTYGSKESDMYGFRVVLVPVPEPAALSLLAVGVLAVLVRRNPCRSLARR